MARRRRKVHSSPSSAERRAAGQLCARPLAWRGWSWSWIVPLLAMWLFSACTREAGTDDPKKEISWEYEKEFGPGPVTLVLRLDRTDIELADTLLLEQELRVEPGFEGDFPEFLPEDFESLTVTDIESETREEPGGEDSPASVRVSRKRLTLEPETSGACAVAPLWVYYRAADEKGEQTFATDKVDITVRGLENVETLQVRGPRDIFEAPPRASDRAPLMWAAASVLGLALTGLVVWYFLRRPRKLPPPPLPHEIAWEALRRLVAQDFVGKGEVELFYVHLSAILRQYIENRFQVHAPERTTEEFLEEAARSQALDKHRVRLGEFLDLCDQVKFALYQPETATIQSSFDVVKRFIEETTRHAD